MAALEKSVEDARKKRCGHYQASEGTCQEIRLDMAREQRRRHRVN